MGDLGDVGVHTRTGDQSYSLALLFLGQKPTQERDTPQFRLLAFSTDGLLQRWFRGKLR